MKSEHEQYLQELIRKKDNGRVKVITGSGKAGLLISLYRDLMAGLKVYLDLNDDANSVYLNPFELNSFVKERIKSRNSRYYVFLDGIENVYEVPNPYVDDPDAVITVIDVLLGLIKLPNADVYVTISAPYPLSSYFPTQFRDRYDEIRVSE
ncbi:MAG: hypothetical protein ACI4NM_11175 [Bullifex sp.]